jgi:hypothetical protein
LGGDVVPGQGTVSATKARAAKSDHDDAANEATAEEVMPEHGKINTLGASPVEPGHLEVEFS